MELKEEISLLSRKLKDQMRSERHNFYTVRLSNMIKEAPSKFWRSITPKQSEANTFVIDSISTSEPTKISNSFNENFTSVFTVDNGSTPTFEKYELLPSLDDIIITESGILNLLLHLDEKKSPGPDDIPNAFLKRYAEWCAKFLVIIFNLSVSTGVLPEDWKVSKIKPLFKQGDKQSVTNYRPIALTSTCCKLLEHVIHKHITVFLNTHSILSTAQHGFRRGFSTATQLVETVHDFAVGINDRKQTDVIFIDFAKAFDKISHIKLMIKLRAIVKNVKLCNWIQSYLTSRYQYVIFKNSPSKMVPVTSGVPQGSVLGPLLFLLYVNDIVDEHETKIRLYADDCLIYSTVDSLQDQINLNSKLNNVIQWCNTWQMSVIYKKSAVMSITNKKQPLLFNYTADGNTLTRVREYKYLGLLISDNLHWDKHITNVANHSMFKLHYLKRALRNSPTSTNLLAYKSIVLPILDYGNIIWDPFTAANLSKLNRVQNKAVRFIFNCYGRASVSELTAKAGLLKIADRNKLCRLRFLFKIVKNQLKSNTHHYITYFSSVHSSRHRHSLNLTPFQPKNNVFKYSFFPRTVIEWNNLDGHVVEQSDINKFESLLAF